MTFGFKEYFQNPTYDYEKHFQNLQHDNFKLAN